MRIRAPLARAGFTLVEVLVTLVLLALLLGVIVPQVVNQLDRGDPTAVTTDLESVRSGARLFRVDVKRYPATLEQLSENPTAGWDSAGDINAATITAGLQGRWDGPYLEGSAVTTQTGTLSTALGGTILGVFGSTRTLAGNSYLSINVTGIGSTEAEEISEIIDGDNVLSDDDAGGRVRFVDLVDPGVDTLVYLALPIN